MGAVENNLVVLPVQTCSSPADEPRMLCIVHNMVDNVGQTCQPYSINLPISVSCQTLIDDIRSKFEHLPKEINVVYKRPSDGDLTVSVSLNEYPEKSIGEICFYCGDRNRKTFHVYEADTFSLKEDNWDTPVVKPKSVRSNAIYESSDQSHIISQVSSVELGCSNKDSYNVCSASTSYSNYSFSLSTLPKSDTGYVGLINQAMTCYLNSLLQTLYMTPEFRNAVYRWKFEGSETDAMHSIPYQLQRLFLQLQTSHKRAVETTDITRSFGWDSSEAWHQHDIQELCRVMFDALEKTWRSTDQENLINELYQGEMKDYVKCLKCRSVRARLDTYLDLPLVIRPYGSEVGYGSVEQALKGFEEPEILESSNQYFCEQCGQHCDAHKGLQIVSFPYILTLHLKRFGFDHCTYQRFKLNDRMTFPEILRLERCADEGESNGEKSEPTKENELRPVVDVIKNGVAGDVELKNREDVTENEGVDSGEGIGNHSNKTSDAVVTEELQQPPKHVLYEYQLYSVMVHSGNAVGGHYYAYIRSFQDGQWYSFNDQHVFKIGEDDMERTFGGSLSSTASYSSYSSSTNAYMLQYRLVDPARNKDFMDEADFSAHLREELANISKKEEEELQQRELDRNTCKIKLYLYHESQEKYTEHKLEVHKSKTLAEATEIAWKQLELTDVPLSCVRLVKFDSVHDYIEQSFEGEEKKTMCCVLGGVKSSYHFDLLLETKMPDAEFPIHFRGGIMVWLHVVDLPQEVVRRPRMLRVLPDESVHSLMLLVSKSFDLCFDTMTLAIDKGYANFCPLFDRLKTLSETGFERVNRVFVECSGIETYDTSFRATKFCQVLDRFVNTVSLMISLPSLNEIARMNASLLRTFYSNQPSANDSHQESLSTVDAVPSDKKPADVDEGIGESESDIQGRTGAVEATSETAQSTRGVGSNGAISRTSDLCSSVCSAELLRDEKCLGARAYDVPNDREANFDSGADETPKRKANLKLELNEEELKEGKSGVLRGCMDTLGELEMGLIACADDRDGKQGVNSDYLDAFESHCNLQSDFEVIGNSNTAKGFPSVEALLEDRLVAEISHATELLSIHESAIPSSSHDFEVTLGFNLEETSDRLSPTSGGRGLDARLDLPDCERRENDDSSLDCPTPATSPRVSSNGLGSPEILENEKELACPKESEENWDLDEMPAAAQESNFSYFRVAKVINGLFEQTLNAEVDRRMTIGQLKTHLEPYMGTSADNFRVFRYSPTGPDIEMTRLYDQLHSIGNGSKMIIKLGRALKPGEQKLSIYQLLIHDPEPVKFLVDVIVPRQVTLQDLKRAIINEIHVHCELEIPVERCRLRRKAWKNPSGVFTSDASLHELLRDSTITELFVEVLDSGPDRMEVEQITLLQIYLRRWRPSTYQLDPVQELILSDWTLANIRKEISLISGIDEENVSLAKVRGQFPCNIPAVDIEDEMQWDPEIVDVSAFPMAVADDGAVLFYKDRTEPLAVLTDEQKKEVKEKESAKLQKTRPIKIPSKAERPLRIYTVGDHDSRLDSQPN